LDGKSLPQAAGEVPVQVQFVADDQVCAMQSLDSSVNTCSVV
jgi:hypothetical protein